MLIARIYPMANKNSNLGAAKTAKNDEFYTQYLDIQKEVNAYVEYNPDVFKGKTILLPCDDPEWSNFTRFFVENFELLGLKKLISTSYAVESKKIKEWEPTLFETEAPQYDADKSRTNEKSSSLTETRIPTEQSMLMTSNGSILRVTETSGVKKSRNCVMKPM